MRHGIVGLAVSAILAAVSLFALAAPAPAEYAHPEATFEFGKEGPKATGTGGGCWLAYQTENKRLYLFSDGKVYGLNVATPGAAPPLSGFPFNPGLNSGCSDPAIAVDNTAGASTNNIFVTPSNPHEIHGFNSSGTPLSAPWPLKPGSETCGLAVTNTGEVWGGDWGAGAVSKYAPTGPLIEKFPLGFNPCKLAVDQTNNDLFVGPYGGPLYKYAAPGYAKGFEIPAFTSNIGIAVNGAANKIYVATGNPQVKAYDTEDGHLVETIDVGGGAYGIAVDEEDDTIWVVADGAIKEFPGVEVAKATTADPIGNESVGGNADPDGAGPISECFFEYGSGFSSTQACDQATPITVPTSVTATLPGLPGEQATSYRLVLGNANGQARGATKSITPHNVKGLKTEAATGVTRESAEFHASFEGDGTETFYYFQWGESPSYGSTSAPPPGPSVGSPTFPPATNLSYVATGLDPATTYHYQVVAENASGESPAQDREFTTLPAVQALTTEPATGVTGREATLNASYLADGDATSYYFEWGTDTDYGNKTLVSSAGTSGATALAATISDLELETTYHYRVVASNSLGSTRGADVQFTTEGSVKGLVTLPATDISLDTVTLRGEFAGNGDETSYWFEYGPTTAYGQETDPVSAGSPSVATQISDEIVDFEGFRTYHFRVVAANSEGPAFGNDLTFETPDGLLPEVTTSGGSAISSTEGLVEAELIPNRWQTVYRIQYGQSTDYGSFTPVSDIVGSDLEAHPIKTVIPGLEPGATYHLRVVAINFAGTTHGPDFTIVMSDKPAIESSSASNVGQTSAHLSALVAAKGSPTSALFEYGTGPSYGSSTAPVAIGSGPLSKPVQVDLAGLSPSTTYHLRAVASNQFGTTIGPDIVFTTAAAASGPPTVQPKPKRCKKGFVKKRGKCVKKRKKGKRRK